MKKIATLLLLFLMASTGIINAQIKSLKDIKPNTPYLLRCVNDYGYCIYNPAIDEMYATLGEALVDHPSGCANDAYHDPIDPRDKNNQWYIEKDSDGNYKLKNAGNGSCISNETVMQMGGWWGGGNYNYATYGAYAFTEAYAELSIEPNGDGIWMFRPKDAVNSNTDTAYLCAASHSKTAIANWKPEDAGSNWEILTVEDDIRLYHKELGGNGSGNNGEGEIVTPEGQLPLGEVAVEGDIHYFCFLDSQLIVIPEQFILDRQEDEQFIKLTLRGDTTMTISKYALEKETTKRPAELPIIESFKFNNKFNDQLYVDADGVIDNEKNTILVQAPSISKHLVASIKLPDEEDRLGTKVWVEGKRNMSKETRRRFDHDITYTVSRPRQYIYKVVKTQNEMWQIGGNLNTSDQWVITPISLNKDMLSTNWPSANSNEQLGNLVDDNVDTYFHSNYSATNNWSSSSYYGDGKTTYPYLQIELAEAIEQFQFAYTTRNWDQHNGYSPQGFIVMASQDGKKWSDVTKLTKDDLPVGQLVHYESPIIPLGKACRYIRLQLTDTTRKNYLVLSEFSMNNVTPNPDYGKKDDEIPDSVLIQPEKFEASFHPYGRDYKVHVDFPKDMTNSEYNLPRIDILFGDSTSWTSSMWIGRRGKTIYENATIQIDGAGIYPDMPKTHMQIRGRGNSSWSNSYSSKNPYRMKFDEKVKPFGMTKGKSWVLLANKQGNSMTTNALAMKIADMVESDGCNHCIPVELYINGQYRGSYNFTEKVGFSNNSIDLEDDSHAAMLELDSYYDETFKFRDQNYNLYVNVKEPNILELNSDTHDLFFQQIMNCFNNFTYTVKNNSFATKNPSTSPLDVNSFVRAWFVTDLTRNTELQHPKSWYIYNENVENGHMPWHFGPVWDFDWSYGYEGHSQYFIYDADTDIFRYNNTGIPFFRQLVQASDIVKKEYYRLWTHFMNDGRLEELIDYCDELMEYVEPSFIHNATKWSDGKSYAKTTENAKTWLRKRANFIYNNMETYDLGEDIIDPWENETPGQPDGEIEAEKPTPIINMASLDRPMPVFNINGQKVGNLRPSEINTANLHPGIYIVGGKKVAVK